MEQKRITKKKAGGRVYRPRTAWTVEDDEKLVDFVEEEIDGAGAVLIQDLAETVDWSKVDIDGRTSNECLERWQAVIDCALTSLTAGSLQGAGLRRGSDEQVATGGPGEDHHLSDDGLTDGEEDGGDGNANQDQLEEESRDGDTDGVESDVEMDVNGGSDVANTSDGEDEKKSSPAKADVRALESPPDGPAAGRTCRRERSRPAAETPPEPMFEHEERGRSSQRRTAALNETFDVSPDGRNATETAAAAENEMRWEGRCVAPSLQKSMAVHWTATDLNRSLEELKLNPQEADKAAGKEKKKKKEEEDHVSWCTAGNNASCNLPRRSHQNVMRRAPSSSRIEARPTSGSRTSSSVGGPDISQKKKTTMTERARVSRVGGEDKSGGKFVHAPCRKDTSSGQNDKRDQVGQKRRKKKETEEEEEEDHDASWSDTDENVSSNNSTVVHRLPRHVDCGMVQHASSSVPRNKARPASGLPRSFSVGSCKVWTKKKTTATESARVSRGRENHESCGKFVRAPRDEGAGMGREGRRDVMGEEERKKLKLELSGSRCRHNRPSADKGGNASPEDVEMADDGRTPKYFRGCGALPDAGDGTARGTNRKSYLSSS